MTTEPVPAAVNAEAVALYLRGLQERICAALETEDGSARFGDDRWERAEGGGGRTRVLAGGAAFEQAGVGFSDVRGTRLPEAATAREMLAAMAEKGPEGYRMLARFQLAAAEAKAGELDKAVAAYDALAKDPSVDSILRDSAQLQAAALRLDKADYSEMEQRLKGLIESSSAWRFSARELLGLSAYRLNDMREAERQFSALLSDQGTPPNLRERADMMLALIVGTPQALSSTTN